MPGASWRSLGAAVGLGLGVLGLTGCEVTKTWPARCVVFPPAPHQDPGSISMTIDAPPQVEAGSTFTLTVKDISYATGAGVLQPGTYGIFSITGGASPSGDITVGDRFNPISWPQAYEVTVTGQPGETITIGVVLGGSSNVQIGAYSECGIRAPLATLQIVAPDT